MNRNTNHSAVASVQDDLHINWDECGIEEDGPVADIEASYSVTESASTINLSDKHTQHLQEVVCILKEAGDQDGLIASNTRQYSTT